MDKNYFELINNFWEFRLSNIVTHQEADLYFAILHNANSRGWPEGIHIPNSTLLLILNINDTSQLCRVRNKLVQLGLISYENGRRGQAGTYKILDVFSAKESPTQARKSKANENKRKIKSIVVPDTFSSALSDAVKRWIEYRKQIGKSIKGDIQLDNFYKTVEKKIEAYGDDAVIAAFEKSISNGWQGWEFNLKSEPKKDFEVVSGNRNYSDVERKIWNDLEGLS